MTLDDNDSLDQMSPKYFRQFRILYNELLGYIERGEDEKIKSFGERVETQVSQTLNVYQAILQRLQRLPRQGDMLQKLMLHQQFRQPKKTIDITHYYPLSQVEEGVSVKDAVKDAVEGVVATKRSEPDTVDSTPLKPVSNVLDRDKVEQQTMVDSDEVMVKDPIITDDVDEKASLQLSGHIVSSTVEDDSGESLNDQFSDQRVLVKKKKDDDLKRSKKIKMTKPKKPLETVEKEVEEVDTKKSRQERVWDYIDDDQSSGGISHEL